MTLREFSKAELSAFLEEQRAKLDEFGKMGIKLDMSRGKPSTEQLDLSNEMLTHCLDGDHISENGVDCRNYGVLDGIYEAKRLFMKMIGVGRWEIIIGGNSSLQMMYDVLAKAMLLGVKDSPKPWCKCEKVKWLRPCPGYDRHFAICEAFGIEMIPVPMLSDGPDMDMVEKLVSEDEAIKGIWCVPDLTDEHANILNILDECKHAGNPDMVIIFASTSKISFPGGGVAIIGASEENINFMKAQMACQTIGYDKLNQLRHAKFFGSYEGILVHMRKHRDIIKPKFDAVLEALDREIAPLEIADWSHPKGGYFISFDGPDGTAKRIVELCKQAGVTLTGAGAAFPYGKDPKDRNIRIAPTYPSLDELRQAIEIFCVAVKAAAAEKALEG